MNWHNKAIKQLTSSSNQDSGVVLPLAFRLIFRICRNEKEIWPELMRIVKSETEKLSWDHTTKDAEWWESLFICSFREHLFVGHLPCDIVLFPMYWVINKRNSPCPCGILRAHPSKKKKTKNQSPVLETLRVQGPENSTFLWRKTKPISGLTKPALGCTWKEGKGWGLLWGQWGSPNIFHFVISLYHCSTSSTRWHSIWD